jgi:hypothetical protein
LMLMLMGGPTEGSTWKVRIRSRKKVEGQITGAMVIGSTEPGYGWEELGGTKTPPCRPPDT